EANQYVTLNVTGNYDTSLPVNLMIIVNANGEIKIRYEIDNVPKEYIREIGVRFEMEDTFDSLLWIRNGYWSFYPPKHLSSETGITSLYTHYVTKYRTPPEKNWNLESKSFFYDGIEEVRNNDQLTYIARSTKENVVEYSLMKNQQVVLSVPGDGQLSCRIIKKNGNIHLYANNAIDYIDLAWGNYQNNIILPRNYANDITLSIR
ncbi:MAG: hypothetical protein ACK2TU_12685, partial [Anaerolineales bacterium]